MAINIEDNLPNIQQNGLNTLKAVSFGSTLAVTGVSTFTGNAVFNGGTTISGATVRKYTPAAVNSSATLTAAQVASGYITTTSASPVTMTMPTGTLLGAQVNAVQGTTLELYIDNTAGANTVTVAVGTNAVQSDWDNQITTATASVTPATVTPLTIASGTSGIGRYTITFSSSTAYVFSRSA
jgi:hypothetical protein